MKNRIIRCAAMLAILCVMVTLVAVPLASAASYSDVYGQTQDKIRVRESASTNATIIDNIIKNACVYVTDSKTSGSSTFVRIKYRNSDGDIATGWACQYDGKTTYVKILSDDQVYKSFGVKHKKTGDYNLPSKKVGTFTASERKASAATTDNTYIKLNSSGTAVKSMQTKLKKLGYYAAEETGNVGPKTVDAIKKFQSAYGLTADGVAGPATLAKMYSTSAVSLPDGKSPADSAAPGGQVVAGNQQDGSTSISSTLASTTTTFHSGMSAAEKLEYVLCKMREYSETVGQKYDREALAEAVERDIGFFNEMNDIKSERLE